MVEFKFHHVMPIFVARQWIRHRTANVNEYSARYSVVRDRYLPPHDRERPPAEHRQPPGRRRAGRRPDGPASSSIGWTRSRPSTSGTRSSWRRASPASWRGSRCPVSVYTEWYWKIDLHNLFHFLSLRMDAHAQQEIRDYANAMFALVQPIVPVAAEAFLDYNFDSMHLTRPGGRGDADPASRWHRRTSARPRSGRRRKRGWICKPVVKADHDDPDRERTTDRHR